MAWGMVGKPFKPFMRRSKNGVTRIVRDNYGKPSEWFALCKEIRVRDNYKCVQCREPENPDEGVYHEVHHIRPLSAGGTTCKANLMLLCKRCHNKRHPHLARATRVGTRQLKISSR